MLERIFPRRADNTFDGYRSAFVLFGIVLFVKAAISLGSIFNGYTAASSADGIPLATYSPAAAQAVVSLFAVLGIANLATCIIGLVVLIRYRSLVPFMFLLFLAQHLARKLAVELLPIERAVAPAGPGVNLALLGLMIVGLAVSLVRRSGVQPTGVAGA